MGNVSKTAKASMKAGQVGPAEVKALSDAERVRLIRMECAQGIYPSCENAHALLRQFDVVVGEYARIIAELSACVAELEVLSGRIEADRVTALWGLTASAEEVIRLDQLATQLEDRALKARAGALEEAAKLFKCEHWIKEPCTKCQWATDIRALVGKPAAPASVESVEVL